MGQNNSSAESVSKRKAAQKKSATPFNVTTPGVRLGSIPSAVRVGDASTSTAGHSWGTLFRASESLESPVTYNINPRPTINRSTPAVETYSGIRDSRRVVVNSSVSETSKPAASINTKIGYSPSPSASYSSGLGSNVSVSNTRTAEVKFPAAKLASSTGSNSPSPNVTNYYGIRDSRGDVINSSVNVTSKPTASTITNIATHNPSPRLSNSSGLGIINSVSNTRTAEVKFPAANVTSSTGSNSLPKVTNYGIRKDVNVYDAESAEVKLPVSNINISSPTKNPSPSVLKYTSLINRNVGVNNAERTTSLNSESAMSNNMFNSSASTSLNFNTATTSTSQPTSISSLMTGSDSGNSIQTLTTTAKKKSPTKTRNRNEVNPAQNIAQTNMYPSLLTLGMNQGDMNQPANMPARFINLGNGRGRNNRGTRGNNTGSNRGGANNRGRGRGNSNMRQNMASSRGSLSNASSIESICRQAGTSRQSNTSGRGRQNQGHNRPQGQRLFGFKKLEELLTKDPEEALIIFVSNMDGMLNYLKLNDTTPDVIVLIFEVLARVIQSMFLENVAHLLLALRENEFFATAKKYIMELPLADSAQKNRGRRFWNAYDQFFLNVAVTLDTMIEVLPATAVDLVPPILKAIIYTMPNIENDHRLIFSDEVCTNYDDLQGKMAQLMETKEKEDKKKERKLDLDDEKSPPNDFHDIDVYPTALEITTRSETYLRKNVIKGAYQDVYHYLDVQFRLLREDFVAPLRDGICEYFEAANDKERKRLSNIKIYKDVRCLGVVPNVNQVGFLLQVFQPKAKDKKILENSRRFMFGSLVCLTSDNFTSIIFGKIIDRDSKYLLQGQLVVGFDVGVELKINLSYIMVECTIYFEPYYQVLSALKMMKEDRFPFKEYLVDVQTESELPGYMAPGTQVDVRHIRAELNPSQLQAYTAAMMSKFCIIQGPPGTGKTYLALKVAHELLARKEVWNSAPMLVICYTNHALDQFLEGLLSKTKNIVRVGGQSKNELLKDLNLRNIRVKNVPHAYFDRQRVSRDSVQQCSKQLSQYASNLRAIKDGTTILNFDVFLSANICPEYRTSWFAYAENIDILEWLLFQPSNRNEVKFDDFAIVTERIQNMRLDENEQNEAEEEEETDNPLDGQRKQNQLDIDFDEDLTVRYITPDSLYDLKKQHCEIGKLANLLRDMQSRGLENDIEYLVLMRKIIKMHINYDYVGQQLRLLQQLEIPTPTYVNYDNPTLMSANDRWLLYGYWVHRYQTNLQEKYVQKDLEYRNLYTEFTEAKDMLDLYKLKNVDVVGMTTTGAARLHKTLQALGCPIVIVEEAAEVLEAHIITALSPKCKHLILIGDHKQLKPSTADYKITKEYNLGVSLFERMVENGLHCHMLDVQHRMRPEIANLVCPAIYPVLHNHESVKLYPNVRGIDSPLYFITHNYPEKESHDRSKENQFEAEYLIQLARYLVLNNYKASQITIIAAYSGQWFVLLALKKKYHFLKDMRICILDNFQGEENDIILLSLVRNNANGKIGFLSLENRICVALSRAKIGMYIMGNMDQLCAAGNKKIWPQVKSALEKYDAIGTYLTVRCENHKEVVTHIKDVKDFNRVPEGGCMKICGKPLACGHTCSKLCHTTSHDNYKCNQQCERILCQFGHQCPDRCFMECQACKVPKFATLPCGHSKNIFCHQTPEEVDCDEMVPTTLPCGHKTDKPCHADAKTYPCPHPCEARVEPCGHACLMKCHIRIDPNHEKYRCRKRCPNRNRDCQMPENCKHNCQKMCFEDCDLCLIEVQKRRSCDHFYDIACHADVEEVICERPCKRQLDCGHKCSRKCNEICGGCKIKVTKDIPECGHKITKWECGLEPKKKDCKNKTCTAVLPCNHPCPLKCAEDCSKAKCMSLVPSNLVSPCNHPLMVPCHMRRETTISNELLSYCTAKCPEVLSCGHVCPGTCGACAQGRFHSLCAEKCDKTLICGHGCVTPCVQNCKPCERPCLYGCEHSRCTKQCGAPCTPCPEDCGRHCAHQICRKKCGEICEIPPCQEPCPEYLPCLHPCIGFCGDPCPPLCRKCDKEEVTEVFFGTEDDEDARFVYLPNCNHTMESTGLDHWFQITDEEETVTEIKVLVCPKCKTNVEALRYRDQIITAYNDIQRIKSEYFGHPKDLAEMAKELKETITGIKAVYNEINCRPVLTYFEDNMKTTKKARRHDNSKAALTALRARLELFTEIAKLRYDKKNQGLAVTTTSANRFVDDNLSFLLSKLIAADVSINEQQIEEFQLEIMRFNRIVQLGYVLSQRPDAVSFKEYHACYEMIFTYKKYTKEQNNLIQVLLKALNKVVASGLGVTDVERKEIVAAIGLSPGHWFKCGNGHFYAIGECGGAMEEGKCPECGMKIGGTRHALTAGNRLAPEMDGARQPAFPTINNIDMYGFD